jgi:hypothetical protein
MAAPVRDRGHGRRAGLHGRSRRAGCAGLASRRRFGEPHLAAVPASTPDGTIVVGPKPVQIRNVARFLDQSNIEPAVQLRLEDRSARARLSWTEDDVDSVPAPLRIDVRGL